MDIREKKKRQLERDFTETGAALNICLTEKFSDVNKILNTYGIVSQRVRDNKTSVAKIQRDLVECKSLLYCNREELRSLWLELVEQRRCLELVDQVDRLRSTPDALGYLVTARAWSEATQLMVSSNYILESQIAAIPAVQTIKTDLALKNKFLIDELKKELNRLLYDKPCILALEMHSRDFPLDKSDSYSIRKSVHSDSDLQNANSLNKVAVTHFVSLPLSDWHNASVNEPVVDANLYKEPRTVAMVIARSTPSHANESLDQHQTQHQQQQDTLSHSDWIREIVAVTHCLMRLQKLPQYLENWRPQPYISHIAGTGHTFTAPLILGQGLIGEIHRSIVLKISKAIESRAVAQNDTVPLSEINSPRYLIKLLDLLFDALFMQARACLLVLRTLNSTQQRHIRASTELEGLTTQYIWSCVQYEVYCILLTHLNNISPAELNELSLSPTKNGLIKLKALISKYSLDGDTTGEVDKSNAALDPTQVDLNALMGRKRMGAFNFSSITTSSSSGTTASTATTTTNTTNVGPISSSTSGNTIYPKDIQPNISTVTGNAISNNIGNVGSSNSTTNIFTANQGQSNIVPLFSFSNASHYRGISTYLSESREMSGLPGVETRSGQNVTEKPAPIYPLACRPSGDNILSVYKMVMEFVEAIEWEMIKYTEFSDMNSSSFLQCHTLHDDHQLCQLRTQLKYFIENIYLPGKLSSLRNKLQKSLNSPDVLTSVVSHQTERELNLNRPVLVIVYIVDQCLNEVRKMCMALPEFTSGCLQIGLTILEDFITAAWKLYKNVGEIEAGGGLTLPSSEWAKDDDVSRFWKKFPSWQRMATHEARLLANNTLMEKTFHKRRHATTTYNIDNTTNVSSNGIQMQRLDDEKLDDRDKTSEGDTAITPVCAIALGLYTDTTGCNSNNMNISTAIPFANDINHNSENAENGLEYMRLHGIIHEREATRLAIAETDQLIHMIRDELPESEKKSDQILPTLRNIQLIKALGRLTESLCWLCHRVLNLDTWTQSSKKYQTKSNNPKEELIIGTSRASTVDYFYNSFVSYAKELNRFSEACLLMTYLEVRIQAFNYFGALPEGVTYWCPLDDVDVDKYVTDFLLFIEQVKDLSIHTFSRHKFRFIFDGLGDFISQLLLRLIPQIERMNSNGNKKMCRNIYRLQQALATLTETHESDLIRVKQLYELFFLTPESVVNRLMEQGTAFDHKVYANLFHLYRRSHSTYAYSKIQSCIVRLATVTHSGQI
ncbi:Exocyst complex component 4 [Schistosoma japonicum]|uniref:Exocyst complex component Sec8 n=2 Tax=Schistosoma japonicum TaxID=6182 RepID=A0A4Z2CR36_SCHJA|nr:Exocyst complex component 4 [Schistosoma japonicum]